MDRSPDTAVQRHRLSDRIRVLSGAQLKYIAFFSMLLDHVNKALLYPHLNGGLLLRISDLFDILGRIAFPLFAFLLVEGFFQTRSRTKYLGNLLLFGLLSEIPFDLFTTCTFYNPNWNNVLFTLALMLLTIWIIDSMNVPLRNITPALWYLLSAVVLVVMCYLSMVLSVDYEYHAILIGYCFYLFHGKTLRALPFCFLSMFKEVWALLGFGLTLTYNGERGRQHKVFNYLFYPVHLLILGILRLALGI